MAKQKIISTKRLLLKPFNEEFLTDRYVGWLNDKELMRFSEQRHNDHTIETCRNYMLSFGGGPNFLWALETKGNECSHIGNINAYLNVANSIADLGVLVGGISSRGKGYGAEAWLGVCQFLFDVMGIRKVTGGTLSLNAPMLNLMSRAGMVNDGVRRRHYLVDGKEVDLVYKALFKEQWDKKNASGQFDDFI